MKLPAMQGIQVQSLGWEDSLENGMAILSSILAWRIPSNRGNWKSMGLQRVDRNELITHMLLRFGKGNVYCKLVILIMLHSLKNNRKISVYFQGKPFNITVIQVIAPTNNAEEAAVELFYEDLQHLLELTPKNAVLFIIGHWNPKVGSQVIPGVTGKFGLGVENEVVQRLRVLPRECNGHSKQPVNNIIENSTQGHHQMVDIDIRLIIVLQPRWRSSIQPAKTRVGTDCGSDHELLIARFRFKLKKVDKTTRTFMYDLIQIPYNYTVEVTNIFKGLDLIGRVPEVL